MNLIINSTDFVFNDVLHIRKSCSGRCYMLVEPAGKRSRAARKNMMAYKPISKARYDRNLEACLQAIDANRYQYDAPV